MEKIHDRYTQADTDRQGRVEKARLFSKATINTLLPDSAEEVRSTTQMRHPHSSLPARGLVEWAGKIATAILPISGVPFLSLDLPLIKKYQLEAEQIAEFGELTKVIQDIVHHEISQSNAREVVTAAMAHVGAIGDVLIHQDDMNFTYFRVDNYIVKRNMHGSPFHIIVRKFIREDEMDDAQKQAVSDDRVDAVTRGTEKFYPYYMEMKLEDKTWKEAHYIGNSLVDGSEKSYKKDVFPWYALRYKHDPYEDWSTSLVEENYGDIISAHATRETLLEGMAIANMGYTGFNPATITPSVLQRTKNWGYVPLKDADALRFIQPNNIQALTVSSQFNDTISVEIRRIFLMDVAAEFTHDRVTAFQISQANQALERASGGTLSTIKNDLLKPMARVTLEVLSRTGKLPAAAAEMVDDGEVELVIKSGIDSIRSDAEDQIVFQFYLEMVQAAPETQSEFDIPALLRWRAKQRGVPTEILKNNETKEVEAEQQLQGQVQDQLVQGVGSATQGLAQGLLEQNG